MKKLISFILLVIQTFALYSQSTYSISGYINKPEGTPIEGLEVSCNNNVLSQWTDQDGYYRFDDLEAGLAYEIKPISPSNDFRDGVTLLDAMKIRCFIYGNDSLSLHQMIAGHVDGATDPLLYSRLTNFDVGDIYWLVIGRDDTFNPSDDNSWVYIPESYEIPQLEPNPNVEPFELPTSILVDSLIQNWDNQNFIAIKRGDVVSEDDFLIDTLLQPAFFLSEVNTCEEETVVAFYVEEEIEVSAFQFSLSWDVQVIRFQELQSIHPDIAYYDNWYKDDEAVFGRLNFAWISLLPDGVVLSPGQPLFEIVFDVAGEQGEFSEVAFADDPVKIQVVGANCTLTNPSFTNGSVSIEFVPSSCDIADYPLPNFDAPDTICVGECVQIENLCQSQALSWQWTMEGASVTSSEEQNPGLFCYDIPGRYRIEQTIEGSLCQASYEHWIEVVTSSAIPEFEPIQRWCEDSPFLMDATTPNAVTYLWDDGSTSPKRSIEEEGLYFLTLTDAYCSRADSIWVERCGKVYVPNSFSPNDDGINDRFEVFTHNAQVESITIYNRWGALVYSGETWDGTFKGKDAEKGVYVYVLNFLDLQNNEAQVLTGDLLLLR